MARKILSGSFNSVHDFEEEPVIIGLLESRREVEWSKGKKSGISNVYTFVLDDSGKKVDVWGSAIIDRALEDVAEGTRIEIEFKGKKKTKDGNQLNIFEVYEITAD